ncbi:MAG: GAF domain-containing protein, partial [Phycisphaerae bacterium]|nr:GAF domain-containing protein [Phycisphaerae bacterium]
GADLCRTSHTEALHDAAGSARLMKYVCHAGLAQYAAGIELDGHVLGTIVLGDKPEKPVDLDYVRRIARAGGMAEEKLVEAAKELKPWHEESMRNAIEFLRLLAETLTRLCYQQANLEKRIEELVALSETSNLLASTLDPDTLLDTIVETMAKAMHVKACSMRLLTETGDELAIKAAFGMSSTYLRKGPVLVAESPNDQRALAGEAVLVEDMATDPRVRYPAEAKREGLVSSLAIGLISKGRPLGTLHIYTDERHEFNEDEIRMFRAMASQAATAVDNALLVVELLQRRQTDYELELAGDVQRRMLPAEAPQIPGYDAHSLMVPCLQVAGDYYDYIPLAGGLWGLAVGDVAGKGVPAAILMASVRSSLRAQVQNVYDLEDVIGRVNQQLCA